MHISGFTSGASVRIGTAQRDKAPHAAAPAPAADCFGKIMSPDVSPEMQALINKGEDRAIEARMRAFEHDKANHELMQAALPEVIGHLSEQLKTANPDQRREIELAIAGHQSDLSAIPDQLDALLAEFEAFREANAPTLALIAKYRTGSAQTITNPFRA